MHGGIEVALENNAEKNVSVRKDYYESVLFTMKFHLVHDLCEDLNFFGSLTFMDASSYEQFNVFLGGSTEECQ